MISREVKLRSDIGLHARPSARISEMARSYEETTKITLSNPENGEVADARSILSLLSLAVEGHKTVVLTVTGDNEEKVFKDISEVIENFTVD